MLTAMLILAREGFEVTLVVGVIYAYLHRTKRDVLLRSLWQGVVAAVALSTVLAFAVYFTISSLKGTAELRTSAVVSVVAAGVLTSLLLFVSSHSRSVTDVLDATIGEAMVAGRSVRLAVAGAAFLAVVREMMEAVLFLIAASTTDSGARVLTGSVLGLAGAVLLGYLVVLGGRQLPVKRFFQVTAVALVVFAAGLVSRAVADLQEAGDLGSVWHSVYDVSSHAWLTPSTQVGDSLGAILGWDPSPSVEQILAYLGYLAMAVALFVRGRRRAARHAAPHAAQAAPAQVVPAPADDPRQHVRIGTERP